jgi:hypothetical protein
MVVDLSPFWGSFLDFICFYLQEIFFLPSGNFFQPSNIDEIMIIHFETMFRKTRPIDFRGTSTTTLGA